MSTIAEIIAWQSHLNISLPEYLYDLGDPVLTRFELLDQLFTRRTTKAMAYGPDYDVAVLNNVVRAINAYRKGDAPAVQHWLSMLASVS